MASDPTDPIAPPDPTFMPAPEMVAETPIPTTTPTTAEEPARKRSWGNAYTWMLVLSFFLLTIGCLILLREWSFYDFQPKPT